MNLNFSVKKYLSISVSLTQVLSTSLVNLSAADLRPRNHIQPLGNNSFTPQMNTSANGRDVVNIVNPNSEGISHNKYESFDIAKDNGVILNNSQENGVSITGGFVAANPNLSLNAKLIINEILSNKNTSLEGTLEVFGKNADVIIANENGLVVNGVSFINTGGVTLTTGVIDDVDWQISIRQGEVNILNGGVGLDGDYFSIISQSMKLSGSIGRLDGNPLKKINFIAGVNDVELATDISDPVIKDTKASGSKKPELSIDGNMLGSMYAGYIHFISTENGVGVRHSGVIKSASDISIDAKGDIQTSALIAQNIDLKSSSDINNKGLIVADKKLMIEAHTLNNFDTADYNVMEKLGLELKTSYLQGENIDLKMTNLFNQGKIIALQGIYMNSLSNFGEFENKGNISSKDIMIQTSVFKNSGVISSGDLKLQVFEKNINFGDIQSDLFSVQTKNYFNQGTISSNTGIFNSESFENQGKIKIGNLDIDTQKLINSSQISTFNIQLNIQEIENTGNIESVNQLFLIFKDTSENLSNFFHNSKGIFHSDDTLSLKSGSVDIDSEFGKMSANGKILIESNGDISIKKTFSNIGSIGLKATGSIFKDNDTLLASQNNVYLDAKTFLNRAGGYVFGKNITIKADDIINSENSTIDAQFIVSLRADTIDNNMGTINSGGNMELFVKTLNNTGKTLGSLNFIDTRPGWLHYYFAKDYFGNRNFNASYTGYNIINTLENTQAVIKSGGNLKIGFIDGGKTDIYNNDSIIAAFKNIDIVGNVYNTTSKKEYSVQDLLKRFSIESIEATPTYLGNTNVYRLGRGNPLEVLDKAKYSSDDNAGYFGLLKDFSSKNQLFKSLMAEGFGVDWLSKDNPKELNLNQKANISFVSKNPAQIVAGDDISIRGEVVYNSTGSIQKIKEDINTIKTNLKNIQDFDTNTAQKVSENSPDLDKLKNQNSIDDADKNTSKENILESVGLSEQDILGLGKQLLFHAGSDILNSKISYYIETRPELVDMDKFYGSQYFFTQVGYEPNKPISVIGDAYYENRLLNHQLIQNLGYSNALSANDVKDFLDNAVLEQKKLGLVIGEALNKEQISKLNKDIVWYVSQKINGNDVLVPQLYYSKNTSFKKTTTTQNSNIASLGDLFLDVGMFQNQSSDLNADGTAVINAKGEVKNIGGVISGDKIAINAKNFLSQSELGIHKSGNFDTPHQGKIFSKGDVIVQTEGDIKIQNSLISSDGRDSKINLISKKGSIEIIDEMIKKIDYKGESKHNSDSSWESATITSSSLSSGSVIQGSNINFKSATDITIKGSSLFQNSKEGSINLISDRNINIIAGMNDRDIKTSTSFSGVNKSSGMREYSTVTNITQKQYQSANSLIGGLGNINIKAKKDLIIRSSGVQSNEKISFNTEGKIDILDSQNISVLNSSYSSYQVFGIKGGEDNQSSSVSSASFINATKGVFLDSKQSIHISGSEINGGDGDIVFRSKKDLKIEAGKNTFNQQSTSYGFGIVGSINAGVMESKVSAGFGVNDGQNFAGAQSNFDSKTLVSGKMQMDSLVSADAGLEFSYSSEKTNSIYYANSNIKTTGSIKGIVEESADIGGANLQSFKDIILQAGTIETSKYIDETTKHSIGFNLSIKQKGQITSSAFDAMNMISNVSIKAADGKNINGGIVAAEAVGSVTNLIFNDLIGAVSTQEGSFQINYQNSNKTSENISNINAGGNIVMQTLKGNINLVGVDVKGSSLSLDSAKDINIVAAKNTSEENGFSFGIQARVQESAGYSALWGNNTDVGVGGNVNVSYNQKNEISYQASNFKIKNQAKIISKEDISIIGGKINATNADVQVGKNMLVASVADIKDSKSLNASLGGDISLGAASSTIGKGNFSFNGGGGYYYKNSKNVEIQSGIVTEGKLNVKVKGNAILKGSVLDSKIQEGLFEVDGKLSISDLDLHKDMGGGNVNLSGGLSGNFGGHINVGDYESEKNKLHSAINITTKVKDGITVNGIQASVKDIYNDTEKTKTILSSTSFSGGDISFSGDVNRIREVLGSKTYSSPIGVDENETSKKNHFLKQDDDFKETFVLQYGENVEQPNFAPPSIRPNSSTEANISSSNISDQAQSTLHNQSLVQKIKNIFRKNKGSYTAEDLNLVSEDAKLVSYGKIYDDIPAKSESVLFEQSMIKHEKDLDKFAAMGEEIPPRIPLKKEKKTSEGDVMDLEDFIDRGIFDIQSLNLSQSVDVLNGVAKNPIFMQNHQQESLKNYFIELLSEVGDNFPYHPDSKDYRKITGEIYANLDDKIINNPKIEHYIKNFDDLSKNHFQRLAKEVVAHYTETLKSVNLDVTNTNIHFSEKFKSAFYLSSNDDIHIPTPQEYKNIYFKNQNPTSQEVGLHFLNVVVHEMTHKQQNLFVRNIDNPEISQNVKDYASIIGLNFQFYAQGKKDSYHLYRNQILEAEAFKHGEETMKKFADSLVDNHDQLSDISFSSSQQSLNIPSVNPQRNTKPFFQRVLNIFSKQNSENNPNSMLPSSDAFPKIEHFPTRNKNLESTLEGDPNFSNVALVYGLSSNREILLESIPLEEIRKRPLIADDYLEALNANESSEKEKRFYDFASSVAIGSKNLLKNIILDYQEPVESPRDEGINSIPRKDNETIFEHLVSNEAIIKIIKNIDTNKKAMEIIKKIAKNRDFERLYDVIVYGISDSDLTPKEKELYERYVGYATALDEERFFGAKTIGVLKNVLDSGGKIYFNLDELVTNYHPFTDKIEDVDLKKLENVFNFNDEYYESITAEELRYIYQNYRTHPNLKFTVKKQVIENPFKDADVIKVIESQINKNKI
ncbi:hemagglutinin repeat-containing protein [Helicobacter cappadocius]|uniref:Hemagglutinin repeat-containing protein n=1 Tax=Helicobacter cappadocius TaxID=3063998 RepID=A0AA90PHM0_9HELI|nr:MULTISPECIES: hemagglutinin repeat-containing protein [unclassified Helicobacter]MDO7252575.1 hemagglutinin repeat-containing protein [Helicobacter sp. faydin-H75]MDP2538442.1 hemagglutinin repeat-containing protein [Helicobacter sp. faydin-H76]